MNWPIFILATSLFLGFPAKPSIFARRRAQVYDRTRFFGMAGAPKNFLP
jgi:hypothetical protein